MKTGIRLLTVLSFSLAAAMTATAQEKRITKPDLPDAVQKAVKEQIARATIRGYSTEVENGQREYEVETMVNGHTRDVTFSSDGQVLEVEEQVELANLSSNVRNALQARAGGNIARIESISKQGKLVAYEAHVHKAGKRYEVQVGPNGELLAHEE